MMSVDLSGARSNFIGEGAAQHPNSIYPPIMVREINEQQSTMPCSSGAVSAAEQSVGELLSPSPAPPPLTKTSDKAKPKDKRKRNKNRQVGVPAAVIKKRRLSSNAQERWRMRNFNRGFDRLRNHLPALEKGVKLSKFKTVELAMMYISALRAVLNTPQCAQQA